MMNRAISPGLAVLLTWPGTPIEEQLNRAIKDLEGNGDSNRDAGADSFILEAIQENRYWQDWAIRTFMQSRSNAHGANEIIWIMSEIARDGDDPDTIGLALENRNLEYAPHQTALAFSLLARDPQWMGFCTHFINVRNLSAIIGESKKEKGRIGTVVCCSPHLMSDLREGAKREQPKPTVPGWAEIFHILEWHGASEIYWTPQENNELTLFPIEGQSPV